MWGDRNPHTLLAAATSENALAVSSKVEHKLTIRPSNSTGRCLPKRNENLRFHEDVHVNVRSSIMYGSPKVETSVHQQVDDKQNGVHPYNGNKALTQPQRNKALTQPTV